MFVEILLSLILLTNITQLIVISSIFMSEDEPELSEEMRAKIYS